MKKQGYSVQMSFDIPDSEKRIAEKASYLLEELVGRLRLSSNHLNIIYEPFSKYDSLDPQMLMDYGHILRNYRDQIKKNYQEIMESAFQVAVLMGEFSTDTKTVEMMDSFIANIKDLEKQVNRLLVIFSDIGSNNFKDVLIRAIDNVKKQSSKLKQLINDRILDHIDTNILAKRWTSSVTDENQNKIYEKVPLIIQLLRQKQKALEEENLK